MADLRQAISAFLRKTARDEDGSAIVEFVFAATVLLIPMVYLILAASHLQAGSYAVVGAADQAAKVFAISDTPVQAQLNARETVSRAMSNFGYTDATTTISCDAECLSPGSVVTITVELDVPLPFVSEMFEASVFSVDAAASQRVDQFG
ncbi:TadE/TadG family type IV pilus assembly protein [Glutamicibacter mishrai]|uniref:TadE/TadG family type IV pilus assembly protein n=1 Tax=Glutamicibacter mishrai TaxID=1775880 RepID=UPI003F7AFE3C